VLFKYNSCCTNFVVQENLQYSTAQQSTAEHSTAQQSTAEHSTAQHSTCSMGKAMLCICMSAVNALDTLLKAFFNILLLTDKSTISLWDVSVSDTSKGGSIRCYLDCFLLSVSWLHPFKIAHCC